MISKSVKMAEVININHHLLSVIHKAGIRLGFGDATLEEVSIQYSLNPDFVVALLNTYNDPRYLPEDHLKMFSVQEIVDYLRRSHRIYIREQLPELAMLFEKYADETNSMKYNKLLRNFFSEYRSEIEKHFIAEDERMFPYALAVEKALLGFEVSATDREQFKNYTIKDFLQEHDNIEVKLSDLRNLIVKYIPQADDSVLAFLILEKLYHLNRDLEDHSRIEEKVLIPKVSELEAKLKDSK